MELWNRAMGGDDATWRAALQDMIAAYHPEAALDYRRTLPDFTPTRRTEAIVAWTESAREAFGEVRLEPQDYVEAGGAVVVPMRVVALGASSRAEVAAEFAYVFLFRDQQVISSTTFATLADALKAVGLVQ